MKDLVEFARAKKAGHEFEYMAQEKWKPLFHTIGMDILIGRLSRGKIRIKPNKTYYRAFRMGGAKYLHERNEPFEGFDEWSVSMGGIDPYEPIKDFEIEQPVKPSNETSEINTLLEEMLADIGNSDIRRLYRVRVEAVIKGDIS